MAIAGLIKAVLIFSIIAEDKRLILIPKVNEGLVAEFNYSSLFWF